MQKVTTFLKEYGMIIMIGLLSLNLMKSCGTASTLRATKKEINQLDSSLRKEMKIEGLKTSKRTLYDWNSVIRTVNRPDDLMKQYDEEINKLSK